MRLLLLALAFAPTLALSAQQPIAPGQAPASSSWQHVQALRAGTSINVKARTSHASCTLRAVDDDTLTCTRGKDLVFQRSDILTIKDPHRGRSTLVGLAIGGGAGAIAGAVAAGPCNNFCIVGREDVALIFGVGLGAVGAITGALTDFTRSTIYKAP
jgi:hypothetical protein